MYSHHAATRTGHKPDPHRPAQEAPVGQQRRRQHLRVELRVGVVHGLAERAYVAVHLGVGDQGRHGGHPQFLAVAQSDQVVGVDRGEDQVVDGDDQREHLAAALEVELHGGLAGGDENGFGGENFVGVERGGVAERRNVDVERPAAYRRLDTWDVGQRAGELESSA